MRLLLNQSHLRLAYVLLNSELSILFFNHLKLELLTQFQASNDNKYFLFFKDKSSELNHLTN